MDKKEAYEKGKQAALAGKNLYPIPNNDILPAEIKDAWVKGFEDNTKKPQYKKVSNSFQNGRTKAMQELINKAGKVGVRLENEDNEETKKLKKKIKDNYQKRDKKEHDEEKKKTEEWLKKTQHQMPGTFT